MIGFILLVCWFSAVAFCSFEKAGSGKILWARRSLPDLYLSNSWVCSVKNKTFPVRWEGVRERERAQGHRSLQFTKETPLGVAGKRQNSKVRERNSARITADSAELAGTQEITKAADTKPKAWTHLQWYRQDLFTSPFIFLLTESLRFVILKS